MDERHFLGGPWRGVTGGKRGILSRIFRCTSVFGYTNPAQRQKVHISFISSGGIPGGAVRHNMGFAVKTQSLALPKSAE